jgi:hypothetical protein
VVAARAPAPARAATAMADVLVRGAAATPLPLAATAITCTRAALQGVVNECTPLAVQLSCTDVHVADALRGGAPGSRVVCITGCWLLPAGPVRMAGLRR